MSESNRRGSSPSRAGRRLLSRADADRPRRPRGRDASPNRSRSSGFMLVSPEGFRVWKHLLPTIKSCRISEGEPAIGVHIADFRGPEGDLGLARECSG